MVSEARSLQCLIKVEFAIVALARSKSVFWVFSWASGDMQDVKSRR